MIRLEKISKKYKLKEKRYANRLLIKKILSNIVGGNKKINDTDKDYFFALRDIDLHIEKGEHIGIIGDNKAGKTTLLQIISGITDPSSGKLYVEGKIIQVFAQGTMYTADLTGKEYIYLHASALGHSKRTIDDHIEDIIDFSEITQIDSLVKFYSTGMHTRLSLSIILHLPADIYILDEGFLGSDIFFKDKVINGLKAIASKNDKIIFFVSHNEDLLKSLCNRLILLETGMKIMDGQTNEVWEHYKMNKMSKSSQVKRS